MKQLQLHLFSMVGHKLGWVQLDGIASMFSNRDKKCLTMQP